MLSHRSTVADAAARDVVRVKDDERSHDIALGFAGRDVLRQGREQIALYTSTRSYALRSNAPRAYEGRAISHGVLMPHRGLKATTGLKHPMTASLSGMRCERVIKFEMKMPWLVAVHIHDLSFDLSRD